MYIYIYIFLYIFIHIYIYIYIGDGGGAPPGNRFVSFVCAYMRSGCLELDLNFPGSLLSLFPLVPGGLGVFPF